MGKRFLKLNEGFFKHLYWQQDRTYSFAEAWLDLIWSARFDAKPMTKIVSRNRIIQVNRGEIHASIRFLAERWGWNKDRVQRFLQAAKKRDELIQEMRQGESIIILCNFGKYNILPDTGTDTDTDAATDTDTDAHTDAHTDKIIESIETSRKHNVGLNAHTRATPAPSPHPITSETLENRKKAFMDECAAYLSTYDSTMIKSFFNYWTETNKPKSKMRFELQKTWDIAARLKIWENNEFKFSKNENNSTNAAKRGCSDEELAAAIMQGIGRAKANANQENG